MQYMPRGRYANFGIGDMIDLFTQGKVFSAFQWLAVGLFMIPEEFEGQGAGGAGIRSSSSQTAAPGMSSAPWAASRG